MIKYIILIIIATFGLNAGISDLVKGRIVDQSGKPIEVSIEFTDEYGKRIIINSDYEGYFTGPIVEGSSYTLSIKGYIIDKQFKVESNNDYDEHQLDLTADKIDKGTILLADDLFEIGTAIIKSDSRKVLKEIRKSLDENDVRATLLINTADLKGNKSKKEKVMQERKRALIMELFKYNIPESRLNVELAEKTFSDVKSNIIVQVR